MELEQKGKSETRDERVKAARRRDGLRWLVGILAVFILVGGGMFAFGRLKNTNKANDQGELGKAVPIMGREHIAFGAGHPQYNSNPPSSGWHYQSPAPKGFHEESVADETAIHNLEHGDIWLAFHPRIATSTKETIKALAVGKMIASPREANDFDISLVSWGRVDSFNIGADGVIDVARIGAFSDRYRNTGPERVF
ncbi:MAG: DUF3105 domain-containing protein [Candidatus Vogelbacteria bacterium]|nr:DUF3105 domain-containing protein [Candidatus Vogelbacteria bacterium]